MTPIHWLALITLLSSSSACAQAPDRHSATDAAASVDLTEVTRASPQSGPLAARADSLTWAGRPWQATLLLASALRAPSAASSALRLAGARAAAGWSGWTEVDRILLDAPWLDAEFDGEGRALLVRSQLERGVPALDDARRALAAAQTEAQRVTRRVLLARAFDRANVRDSAAMGYASAATRLPGVADWLRLRAAGVTSDDGARSALLARVTNTVARARVPWTDAQARERGGDFAGAARAYRLVRAEPAAFRVEALAARDSAARTALAGRIVVFLESGAARSDVRLALEVLDKSAASLSRAQELAIARAAANAGSTSRAITGFQRALAGGPIEPRDQLAYAGALASGNRASDAIRIYTQIESTDTTLGPRAAYQRARTMLQSGNGAGARAALRAITARYASVRDVDAPALLLLADLQTDDGELAGAAKSLADLVRRHPGAPQAPLARIRAALLTWNSDPARAAAAFDSLASLHPTDEEARAARYWAGRAHERAGSRAEAQKRWRELATAAPLTYYGVMSARRLSALKWTPPAGPDTVAHIASVDSAVARVRTLELLGMDVEARFEIDALVERGEQAIGDVPAIAQALTALGEPARALRLAARAIERGAVASRALLRAVYPVVHQEALLESSRRTNLDPALVAGLIRQESTWNPDAVSPVGARGLMQLMPSVGTALAASRRYPVWSPALLFEPDVSLQLGTIHLASSLTRADGTARALAAYNAGGSRVARWARRPGAADPELFTEWIPFTETRDYVRVVQRNAEVYRALYGWR